MTYLPEVGVGCHETGFEKDCRDMVVNRRCRKWIQIQGTNPNTGESVNRWDCVDAWFPLLLIENSQMQRQTGAAVESFRNEVVRANQQACQVIAATALPRHSTRILEIESQNG
jgi:hypothetical protein